MSSTVTDSRSSLLSDRSAAVVAATAGVVAANAEQITGRFYPRMFTEHPELHLIDPTAPPFDRVLERIAYNHISLGIRPEQYTIVGYHLLGAVGEVLGDAVTPEIADAWNEVYWLFATQLIAEEARMYQLANVDPTRPVRPYRVIRRIEETQDVISLILEPADDDALPEISPGQYVSVFVDLPNGQRQPRQYTVSSTGLGNRLQITVRRVLGGAQGPALIAVLKASGIAELAYALGIVVGLLLA